MAFDGIAVCRRRMASLFFINLIVMKRLLLISICLAMFTCTQKATEQTATSDSTKITQDTAIVEVEYASDPLKVIADESEYDSTDAEYMECLAEKASGLEASSVYHLTASFNGYESSQDATYFFDSLYNLTYCNVSWSMEVSSGNYSYYFENDKLIAGKEDNFYNAFDETTIFCDGLTPFAGLTSATGEDEADPEHLTESDLITKNNDALNEYQRLLSRISEYATEAQTEDGLTKIHIENIVNYGDDYTETENFEMNTSLFEALFR